MTKEEVIAKLSLTQEELVCASVLPGDTVASLRVKDLQRWRSIAEAQLGKVLNLTYPCSECEGTGQKYDCTAHNYIGICSTCNGTGKGSPMIAILDEKQEFPNWHCFADYNIKAAYRAVQKYMIGQGWRITI